MVSIVIVAENVCALYSIKQIIKQQLGLDVLTEIFRDFPERHHIEVRVYTQTGISDTDAKKILEVLGKSHLPAWLKEDDEERFDFESQP